MNFGRAAWRLSVIEKEEKERSTAENSVQADLQYK